MISIRFTGNALALLQVTALAACNLADLPNATVASDLRAQTQRGEKPDGPDGACWASDETPAVIETVTEQIAEGPTDQSDGGYRTETSQNIVQPREKIWFQTPCEAALTPEVIATLQRALAARGHYTGDVNGVLDATTEIAIRAFQSPRGLNSDHLSLAAARELGVVASDFGDNSDG